MGRDRRGRPRLRRRDRHHRRGRARSRHLRPHRRGDHRPRPRHRRGALDPGGPARPGLCDGDRIALATDVGISLLAVGDGEEEAVIDVDDAGDPLVAIPFGERVAVSSYGFIDGEPTAHATIHPRGGGDPIWEDDGAFAFPVTEDLVLTADDGEDEATFVRAADGEEVGTVTINGDDNGCFGALSRSTIVVCETGEPTITSHRLSAGLDELWALDAGAGVEQVAVGGDRLFVLTEEGDLIAFR